MHQDIRGLAVALAVLALATPVAAQPAMELQTEDVSGPAGGEATLNFTVANSGDEPSSAILDVSLPDGWSVASEDSGGASWKAGETKWLFQTVEADSERRVALTLSVPEDAGGDQDVATSLQTPDGTTNSSVTVTVTEGGAGGGDGLPDGPMLYVVGAIALVVIVGGAVYVGKQM